MGVSVIDNEYVKLQSLIENKPGLVSAKWFGKTIDQHVFDNPLYIAIAKWSPVDHHGHKAICYAIFFIIVIIPIGIIDKI